MIHDRPASPCPGCGAFVPLGVPCGSAECQPKATDAPCERPPQNGAYTGPLKVRTLPPGASAEKLNTSQYFRKCAANGVKAAQRRAEARRSKSR